jgi:hypothetical protein
MRWDLMKTLNDSHHWALHAAEVSAGLRYNSEAHSIRLATDDKRLFFLEKTGMIQSKIILRTEYSVIIGESFFGKNRLSGILVLNENKYSFKLEKDHLKLFNRHKEMIFESQIDGIDHCELFEFAAMLFGSGLVASKYHLKPQLELD